MKVLILIALLFSNILTAAEICRDVSMSCLGASKSFMTSKEAENYCSNVATNCFKKQVKQDGFYGARDKCLNVSASCYDEVFKIAGSDQAIQSCSNVSTRCYRDKRATGITIKGSIMSCFDVYIPCRTCFNTSK